MIRDQNSPFGQLRRQTKISAVFFMTAIQVGLDIKRTRNCFMLVEKSAVV